MCLSLMVKQQRPNPRNTSASQSDESQLTSASSISPQQAYATYLARLRQLNTLITSNT